MSNDFASTVNQPPPLNGGPAGVFAGTLADDLAVAVAPSTGRFRPAPVGEEFLRCGELLGHVTGGRGRADEVRCPVDARIRDLLVRPGQLVLRGQAIAWLERDGGADHRLEGA